MAEYHDGAVCGSAKGLGCAGESEGRRGYGGRVEAEKSLRQLSPSHKQPSRPFISHCLGLSAN